MTSPLTPAAVDTELLDLGQLVLQQAGYTVVRASIEGAPYLVGEDQDNVVVVAAVVTVDDVFAIQPGLSRALVERWAGSAADSKKWDGFVIVLTAASPDDTTTEALFSLTYNLHQVRRLVRVGVEATNAGVARSLRPVLPLSQSISETALSDPLTALEHRIVADGLDADDAALAISTFRAQAGVIGNSGNRDESDGALESDDA